MDALMYLKEKDRMCKNYWMCDHCPASCAKNGLNMNCTDLTKRFPEKMIDIVKVWSNKHQLKTRKTEFVTKYPNAPLNEKGYPYFTPINLGYCSYKSCSTCPNLGREYTYCWDEPLGRG